MLDDVAAQALYARRREDAAKGWKEGMEAIDVPVHACMQEGGLIRDDSSCEQSS